MFAILPDTTHNIIYRQKNRECGEVSACVGQQFNQTSDVPFPVQSAPAIANQHFAIWKF